jgi:Domain of unknown function (DUF4386)
MTLRTNSKVAGTAFLAYIAVALTGMILESRASAGEDTAAKLASIAQHAGMMRAGIVLEMLGCFCALVLAVTLYAITRDEDRDLALLGATFRIAEGVIGAVSLQVTVATLRLGTTTDRPDAATMDVLGAYLFKLPWSSDLGATFFAVGSTIFACLLLRGRIVPVWLAWLGVVASILILLLLPLKLVRLVGSPITDAMWLPMLVFEVSFALYLIVKGAKVPVRKPA